ncbi:MAG: Hpt domain-containing protein [Clostridia bacterium]|nr:Hpt domain-containing protein [Clostridia bacterium]
MNHECRYDIQGLTDELEVELKDIVRLFSNYFEEMQSEMSEMEKFLSQKDWVMLQRVAHNIKGVSANLGIQDVFSEAAAFDAMLKAGITESAVQYVNGIKTLLKNANAEVDAYFSQHGLTL